MHAQVRLYLLCSACFFFSLSIPMVTGSFLSASHFGEALDANEEAQDLKNGRIMKELEQESDFDFTGHPASYGGLPVFLDSEDGWNIRTMVDSAALAKHGIRLESICPYRELRAGGVSRRSSLRFVLNAGGLAFYVDGNILFVTTKAVARVKWISQLDKPNPSDLCHDTVRVRREAAFAAGFWHLDTEIWIEALRKALNDPDRQVAFDAAYALGEIGPQAAPAIDGLVNLLKSNDPSLREAAVFALGNIGTRSIHKLLQILDHPDSEITRAAAKSFNVMGSVGSEAVPHLIASAAQHADADQLCDAIGLAISSLDPRGESIPTLRELLKAERMGIRAFAAYAIGAIGPPGLSCAHDLVPLLTDKSSRVRFSAAYALSRIDLPADFPTEGIEAALKDPDENVSLLAQDALRVIGSKKQLIQD